jgi:hypothetical protein
MNAKEKEQWRSQEPGFQAQIEAFWEDGEEEGSEDENRLFSRRDGRQAGTR